MTSPVSPVAPASSRAVLIGGLVWLALAITIGASGLFALLPPPGPQIIILALTIAAIATTTWVPAVRAWVDILPLRWLVGMHGVRFVGVVFLVLSAQGALSPIFAARAGGGDIAAAVGALALVASGAPRTSPHRWAYLAWNTFGLLDLVVAVGTATLVVLRGDIPGMEPIVRLPLVLVPTFFVPLLFASHIVIYRRVAKDRHTS